MCSVRPMVAPIVAVTCYKGNSGDGDFEFRVRLSMTQPPYRWTSGAYLLRNGINCYIGTDCFGLFWRYTYLLKGA